MCAAILEPQEQSRGLGPRTGGVRTAPRPRLGRSARVAHGSIADPDGDFSAFPGQGDHIAHQIDEFPETMPVHARAALGIDDPGHHFDTVVMGWNTFAVGLDAGLDSPYPHLRQFVFSRRDRSSQVGDDVEVHHEHPQQLVDQLRAGPGDRDIWLCGGGELAGQLADSIDKIVLKVNPITLGAGIPLFGSTASAPRSFTLAAPPKTFDSGVVIVEYHRQI